MRLRADEAMRAALAGRDGVAPAMAVLEDAIATIRFACEDESLDPRERVILIDDALRLLATLKEKVRTADASPLELILEIVRRSNGFLRRYARLVRGERAGPP